MALKKKGFSSDIILAHHGWAESLFLKDVWPEARMSLYCEFFHHADDNQIGFDPEFPRKNNAKDALRLRVRNLNNHRDFRIAEAGISPTHFQADTFPATFRDQITVMRDGVDTGLLVKNADAVLKVSDSLSLKRNDKVITFINLNLEPYRRYHQFMRALPKLIKLRPDALSFFWGETKSVKAKKCHKAKRGNRCILMRSKTKYLNKIGRVCIYGTCSLIKSFTICPFRANQLGLSSF